MFTHFVHTHCLTRNSAIADKPARRVCRSVKVTKHSTIRYVRYSLLLCNSNFIFKTCRFLIFDFEKCHDLEIRVRGHSRPLKVLPFYRRGVVSCQCFMETLSIKRTVYEILDFKNAVTFKTRLGVRQGHWKYHHLLERVRLPIDVQVLQ